MMITAIRVRSETSDEGLVRPVVVDPAGGGAAVDRLLACVREGRGGCLVIVGGPRSGKTALLEESLVEAFDMRRVRVTGVESERSFAFAGVHQLLVPFLARLHRLPPPQRAALQGLAGLAEAPSPDHLLVGLAMLTLLVDASLNGPVLVAVDDAQWLDRESAEVLAFVARRLSSHRVAFVVTARESRAGGGPFGGRSVLRPALPAPRRLESLPAPASVPGQLTSLLRNGLALRGSDGYAAAVAIVRPAVAAVLALDPVRGEGHADLFALATLTAGDLLDADAERTLAHRWVQVARELGDGRALSSALGALARTEILAGRLPAAEAYLGESRAFGLQEEERSHAGGLELAVLAWRGRDEEAADLDAHRPSTRADLVVLDLAYGRYGQAVARAQDVYQQDPPDCGTQILPDLVEAAARTGDRALAVAALERLALRASAARTPLAQGLLIRTRAVMTDGPEADDLYQEAADCLGHTVAAPHVARAHLLHGEWLRRRRRRRDARLQLRTAAEMFEAMGMDGFAQRARVELRATGERVSRRPGAPDSQLTPQESQIAQLVSDGLANREIAAQLYLSPNTVEYHLQKVFRKLNLTSRTQLARALLTGSVPSPQVEVTHHSR